MTVKEKIGCFKVPRKSFGHRYLFSNFNPNHNPNASSLVWGRKRDNKLINKIENKLTDLLWPPQNQSYYSIRQTRVSIQSADGAK